MLIYLKEIKRTIRKQIKTIMHVIYSESKSNNFIWHKYHTQNLSVHDVKSNNWLFFAKVYLNNCFLIL